MSVSRTRAPGVDEAAEETDRRLGHYFVPQRVADIANATVPCFDIDPCGHPDQLVKAKEIIIGSLIAEIDGFDVPLRGSCWLNPPAFKALRKDVCANYKFHPLEDWLDKAVAHYDNTDLETLLIYAPARVGVSWYNRLVRECTLQLLFDQRINCLINQRSVEDGEPMAPREMTSPFGGSSLFLFARRKLVVGKFAMAARDAGVLQGPALIVVADPIVTAESLPPEVHIDYPAFGWHPISETLPLEDD